jgi:predicted nucleic acid-binding protein
MSAPPLVSDTSPLLYLGRIGQLAVLPVLFSQVRVPEQVVWELDAGRLLREDTPDPRQFSWLEIVSVSAPMIDALPHNALGLGERAVLAYAIPTPHTVVALDDRQARLLALELQIPVVGLVGILLKAKQAGILAAVKPHLDAARGKGFFLHAAIYAQALAAAGEDWAVSLSG